MSEEIHSLLGRYFSGQATEEEIQTVQNWVHSNEQNEAEFKLLQKLWTRSGDQDAIVFDTDKAWQKINDKLKPVISIEKRSGGFSRKMAIAAAASIVLVLSIWWFVSNKTKTQTILAKENVQEIKLEDGSSVYLRKGSTLEYPHSFAKNNRRVTLNGEAFFEVTHNAERPFIITAAKTEVTVVGTSFSIDTKNEQVELIVKTGLVNFNPVQNAGKKVQVAAGEKAIFANDNIVKEVNLDVNFNAWQTGRIAFKSTPLRQVIATLSDYYNVNIKLKDADADQLSAAGVTLDLNNQSLSSALDELATITSYHIQKIDDNHYEISIK